MKNLFFLSTLLMSLVSFASYDVQSFIFDGSELSKSMTLNDAVYRTEYRQEQRPAICYRTVIIRYNRSCQNIQTGTSCRTSNGQQICRPVYRQQCQQRPVYGRQAFTCFQFVTVAYRVLDHYTQANVNFSFEESPMGITPEEKITVSLDGEALSTKVKSSGRVLMLYSKEESTSNDGSNFVKDIQYKIKLIDLQKALLPSQGKIKFVSASSDELVIETGEIADEFNYAYELKLSKVRFFILKDRVLFNGSLVKDAMEIEKLNGRSLIKINLQKLNIKLPQGKIKLDFAMSLLTEGSILNTDTPSLKFKMKKKFKN